MARTASEFGIAFAHKVVPSKGSSAISNFGPLPVPTFSPINSIGASSLSPSPITTVPDILIIFNCLLIASTAAWSADFSSPLPRIFAAAIAALSVTRTISRVSTLSIGIQ